MNYILYLLRTFFRNLIWILVGTAIIAVVSYFLISRKTGSYKVQTTIYTGIISGYGIEENNAGMNYAMSQNAIDNLINIITSESTLRKVSIQLFARVLVDGNPNKRKNYITPESYNYTFNHMKNSAEGNILVSLIDTASVDRTVDNFLAFENSSQDNYIHGLFYYNHPFYSIEALKKIIVYRLGNSDLLQINYSSSDPGISYNTLEILTKVFVKEYKDLRYGQTDSVLEYFKSELDRIGAQLEYEEKDLTAYNVANRVINYIDETKEIAAINKEFELREQEILFLYNSSKAMLLELEKQMEGNEKQALNSIELLNKLKQTSDLTGRISQMETISSEDSVTVRLLQAYKNQLTNSRSELSEITQQLVGDKYSKTGLTKSSIIEQWLDQTLVYEKAKAELLVAQNSRNELNKKYELFAPIGTTLKQKERQIDFSEQNYLSNLRSYNDALMRKKSLEMTSAALKVLNPPIYPISSESLKRKRTVIIVAFISFLLFTMMLLIFEMLDRTLRDTFRTYKLTQCPILGCAAGLKSRKPLNGVYNDEALKYISNTLLSILSSIPQKETYVVNLLKFENNTDIEFIGAGLKHCWESKGLIVERVKDGRNFLSSSQSYYMAQDIKSFAVKPLANIILVDHPKYDDDTIPTCFLKEADINMLILSAMCGWKSSNRIALRNMEIQIGEKPFVYLTDAYRYDIENFTGMLPPYSAFRRFMFRLSQLSLKEAICSWREYFRRSDRASIISDSDDD